MLLPALSYWIELLLQALDDGSPPKRKTSKWDESISNTNYLWKNDGGATAPLHVNWGKTGTVEEAIERKKSGQADGAAVDGSEATKKGCECSCGKRAWLTLLGIVYTGVILTVCYFIYSSYATK